MGGCCACRSAAESEEAISSGEWVRLGVAGVVAAQSMIFGLAVNISPPSGTVRAVLHGLLAISAVAVFCLAGRRLLKNAWSAAREGRIVFDQLFLLGIAAAFAASVHCSLTGTGHVYYEIVAILLAIYTFGGLLTETRRREAMDAARDLGSEFAECEILGEEGSVRRVAVADVRTDDRVRVAVGGAVCVDGMVESGVSFVREAALTGEPFPVVKRPGDHVRAGSYAIEGGLVVRAQSDGRGRGLDRLFDALEEARARPSRMQREADRLAAWFLPSVMVVAAGTFGFWTWQAGWETGLFNALAVILVACPCAMGIATPVAIWSALSKLAKGGITPKNSDIIEKLAVIDSVVFDKTGTLGGETLEAVDFITHGDRGRIRAMAAALEAVSDHPIARAFHSMNAREGGTESAPTVENVFTVPGAGIAGSIDGHELRIGNKQIVPEAFHAEAERLLESAPASDGATHEIYLVLDGRPVGVAILREVLREGATDAVRALEDMGLHCEVMTGDREGAAEALGLRNVRAGLLPEDKARMVRERENAGSSVLFVGDGINDSAAMMEAHASMAMRSGTALAMESADAEIAGTNLPALPLAVAQARAAVRAIRGNLLFAACYNAVGVTLAAAGFLHPVAAALIMLASSFTVTWRALRDVEEGAPECRHVPVRKRRSLWPAMARPRPLGIVAAVATFLQGPALAYLGGFPAETSLALVLLFAGGALGILSLTSLHPPGAEGSEGLLMFSVGGLAMLGGWWADAGFLPVVRDAVCLCGCPDSTWGFGLLGAVNWMSAAMVVAAIPMLFVTRPSEHGIRRAVCWVAGLAGMLVGMQAGAVLAGLVPEGNPEMNFFVSYGAMLFGMTLGMIAACSLARRWVR
jgi:P-type Cu+ transporter